MASRVGDLTFTDPVAERVMVEPKASVNVADTDRVHTPGWLNSINTGVPASDINTLVSPGTVPTDPEKDLLGKTVPSGLVTSTAPVNVIGAAPEVTLTDILTLFLAPYDTSTNV